MNKERVWNEENLPLAKWLIDKTNTKDYRIGNLSGMKHPKVDGNLLKTVGGREELVRQAKVLERIPALGGEEYLHFDWREMNTDITRIDYRVEVIPRLCELIGIMDPRERQLQAISRICKLQVDVSESCLSVYCDHVLEQLNKGNTKELSKAEDEEFLKCLKALADLKEPEWKRVFSSKVFEKKNDITPSKVFERIYQGAVIEALKYSPQYDEGMSDDEILAVHGILSYSQTLEWKGAVEYCMTDRNGTAIEKKIDTSLNYYGTVLNAQTLEHAVPNLRNSVEKIIVIENKANYESMEYDPKVLYIFCHGYFSPKEIRFLQMLMKTAVGTSVFIMTFTAFTGAVSHFAIGGAPDWSVWILCVVFTFLWARIADVFANKSTPKTLNRVTGVILVVLGVVVMAFSM